MTAFEHEVFPGKLVWAQWLSTGFSLVCFLACTGDLSLRYPLATALWLLGNGLLAAGRLLFRPVGPTERPWLKAFLWLVGITGPGLLWWALTANSDLTFRDQHTSIRQHRTMSMDPEEEEIETRRYRTKYYLFEERMGEIARRPVQHGEKIGY